MRLNALASSFLDLARLESGRVQFRKTIFSVADLIWDRYEDNAPLNVGSGIEHSIADMARLSAAVVGFTGNIVFDSSKPDGMMRKLLDSSRIRAMGWKPQWDLEQGLRTMYDWALTQGVFAEGFRR
jgi:nucleoside-diphosphate-sugar epimerase